MVAIPPRPTQEIVNRIYASYKKKNERTEVWMTRLGASSIGEECIRKVWFDWRAYAAEDIEGRMFRLFDTGHLQEQRMIDDLRAAGLSVWDKNDKGKQYTFTDSTGHLVVKLDGMVKGVPQSEHKPHVLEAKTHNKNNFSALQKKGVQEAKPDHYAQAQVGMMLSGTDRALYVAVCKDDEQYHIERIKEDKVEQKKIQARVKSLVEARLRPAGISDDASSFGCKFCSMKAVCTKEAAPLRTCRSCTMSAPGPDGTWVCTMTNMTLSSDDQRRACEHYEVL